MRKVYEKNYIPRVFSWPVRVEGRVPEGVIQIQQEFSDHRPILTGELYIYSFSLLFFF